MIIISALFTATRKEHVLRRRHCHCVPDRRLFCNEAIWYTVLLSGNYSFEKENDSYSIEGTAFSLAVIGEIPDSRTVTFLNATFLNATFQNAAFQNEVLRQGTMSRIAFSVFITLVNAAIIIGVFWYCSSPVEVETNGRAAPEQVIQNT